MINSFKQNLSLYLIIIMLQDELFLSEKIKLYHLFINLLLIKI
jgi:hypothetical protein